MGRQVRWQLRLVMVCGLVSACASPPLHPGSGAASLAAVGPVEVGVGGALPLIHTRSDPLLASRLGFGGSAAPMRYEARYALEPGDVFAESDANPGQVSPQLYGGQRMGQELRLRSPAVVGAPVALRFTTETRELWKTSGERVGKQRQVADLDWAPGPTKLNLQWVDGAGATDSQLALGCELRGTLQVPLFETEIAGSPALRFSGRDCRVLTPDARYGGLGAETWGMGMAWSRQERETEILLSVIDPVWKDVNDRQVIDPSFEFGVSHRLEQDLWSAKTHVGMRYATAWDLSSPHDETGYYASDSDAYWMASASLTRHLPAVSLSASWAHGADPLWFMPEIGQRRHRVDMRLDLSRVVADLVPEVTPQVSVQWNWSQARSRNDIITGDQLVRLNMALVF